jgi:hypothetical protein
MSVKSGTALLFAASLGLVPSIASAADAASKAPLAPGGAAGVKTAESTMTDNTLLLVGGGALLVGGVALVASGGGHGHGTTTTTTGTSSTGHEGLDLRPKSGASAASSKYDDLP